MAFLEENRIFSQERFTFCDKASHTQIHGNRALCAMPLWASIFFPFYIATFHVAIRTRCGLMLVHSVRTSWTLPKEA